MNDFFNMEQIDEDRLEEVFNNTNDFNKEKDMCDYIEMNIDLFCLDVLNDVYISHEREFSLLTRNTVVKDIPNLRVDFLIQCKKNKYVIEVKNPTQITTELTRALGQILLYKTVLDGSDTRVMLLSSKHSKWMLQTKYKNSLDFDYCLLNKTNAAFYEGHYVKQ